MPLLKFLCFQEKCSFLFKMKMIKKLKQLNCSVPFPLQPRQNNLNNYYFHIPQRIYPPYPSIFKPDVKVNNITIWNKLQNFRVDFL